MVPWNVTLWYQIKHSLLLQRLQSVQNAAARLVTGARRRDHITPVLRQLHWLPVHQRVAFKVAGLVHQSLAGAAPAYLADDCHLLSDAGRRPLRSHSNDIRKLLVPRKAVLCHILSCWMGGATTIVRTVTYSNFYQMFATIGQNVYNSVYVNSQNELCF